VSLSKFVKKCGKCDGKGAYRRSCKEGIERVIAVAFPCGQGRVSTTQIQRKTPPCHRTAKKLR